jgi:photosystem II stability/assembly factor-like uncharacterized protein
MASSEIMSRSTSALLTGAFLALVLASPAPAALNRWTSGGPSAGAVVVALVFDPADPAVVYAGTHNGVFRSEDRGQTWTAASSGLEGAVVFALRTGSDGALYAAMDEGIQKSVDRGRTWQDPILPGPARALAVHPTNPAVLYSALGNTLQKSTDGGGTWNGLYVVGGQPTYLEVDPVTPANVYAGTYAGLYRSTDGGSTWSLSLGPGISIARAIDPVDSKVLYAGTADGVFKSSDRGLSWSRAGLAGQHVYAIGIDPRSPSTLVALGSHGIHFSQNAGKSWILLAEIFNGAAVVFDPSSATTWLVGTYSGIYRSTSGGRAWRPSNTGLAASSVSALAADPHRPGTLYAIVAVAEPNNLYKSSDAGASWTPVEGLTLVNAVAVDPTAPSIVYATSESGFYRSNGEAAWIRISAEPGSSVLVVHPRNSSILYQTGYGHPLLKSVDGGVTWSPLAPGFSPQVLVLAPSAPETLYATGVTEGLFKSTDGGATWSELGAGPVLFNALAVDPRNADVVYAAPINGRILKSTDGGATWFSSGTGISFPSVDGITVDPSESSRLYAATAQGIFRSMNAGATWSRFDAGVSPDLWTHEIVLDPVNPFLLYAATHGGGVLSRAELQPGSSLELNGGRFLVEMSWETLPGIFGRGHTRALTGDTGYAWFFQESNVEVLLKILDGCGINGHSWVFAAGLTNVRTDITVADTRTGEVEIYHNFRGQPFQPIQDTDALACDAAAALEATSAASGPLLLRNGRFRVTAEFATAPGAAPQAMPGALLTDDAAYLWFFDPNNVEVFLKVVDGCPVNGRFWVFAAGLTNVEVRITVVDTQTGEPKVYVNPPGQAFQPILDTSAFDACGE